MRFRKFSVEYFQHDDAQAPLNGSFRAEMMSHGNRLFYTETYRPGWYEIIVRATGYREWRATNVRLRMEADGCHVELVKLVAKLQR